MKQIKVPFPIYEGLEVKSATADIENGYSIVEYGEKEKKCEFKRGDIVYCQYFICVGSSWVAIVDEWDSSYAGTNIVDIMIKSNSGCSLEKPIFGSGQGVNLDICRLATTSEQQILFDALAKEGKYWDADAKEVKDFIKVPESIGIYKWFGEDEYKCGDDLFIGFNNDTQILGYDDTNKCYLVYPKRNDWQEVECYLQPCKREDLKSGDTAFISKADYFDNLDMYYKMIDISEYGFARAFGNDIKMVGMKTDLDIRYYKLTPING